MARNPSGQHRLRNGQRGSHRRDYCDGEYLDDKAGGTDLIGKSAEDRAETRMWARRIDLQIMEPLANGFRFAEDYHYFRIECTASRMLVS